VAPTVLTDRTVSSSKPDGIMRYNKHGTCLSIDVAISAEK